MQYLLAFMEALYKVTNVYILKLGASFINLLMEFNGGDIPHMSMSTYQYVDGIQWGRHTTHVHEHIRVFHLQLYCLQGQDTIIRSLAQHLLNKGMLIEMNKWHKNGYLTNSEQFVEF
jgi:hypothetical protein